LNQLCPPASTRHSYTELPMRCSPLVLIAIAAVAACAAPGSVARSPSVARQTPVYTPASPAERELLPDEQVQQVLNRLAFGARPGDAATVRAMGVDRWIQAQLDPESIPDTTTDRLVGQFGALKAATGDMVQTFQEIQ